MTQKLWWQIARDAVPADTNTTGKPKKSFNDKIKRFMAPSINSQIWNEDIMQGLAKKRTSEMGRIGIGNMRKKLQETYKIKFPLSTALYDTKFFKSVKGEFVPTDIFGKDSHELYGSRSKLIKSVK